MKNKLYRQLITGIRNGFLSAKDLDKIIDSYNDLGLRKSQVRNLITAYEREIMKNVGVLERETNHEVVNKMKKDFGVENIFVREKSENIDQSLRIGDWVYTFNVESKLRGLKD